MINLKIIKTPVTPHVRRMRFVNYEVGDGLWQNKIYTLYDRWADKNRDKLTAWMVNNTVWGIDGIVADGYIFRHKKEVTAFCLSWEMISEL